MYHRMQLIQPVRAGREMGAIDGNLTDVQGCPCEKSSRFAPPAIVDAQAGVAPYSRAMYRNQQGQLEGPSAALQAAAANSPYARNVHHMGDPKVALAPYSRAGVVEATPGIGRYASRYQGVVAPPGTRQTRGGCGTASAFAPSAVVSATPGASPYSSAMYVMTGSYYGKSYSGLM